MNLPDPARSRAVLIGAAHYRALEDLPAVAANLTRLAALLRDPEVWGLPEANVAVVAEPDSPAAALDEIRRAAAGADDTLLVYYAGHGLLDGNDDLLLALPETDVRRPYTAIRFDDLRVQVRGAHRHSAKVIILDCCYSARAIAGGMGPAGTDADDLKRHAAVDGTYLMAAAAETKVAVAPPGETYTAFTGELITVLENGIEGSPDLISVDQIFWQIRGELEAKGRPRPEQGTRNEGATIVLSRNRARRRRGPAAVPAPVAPVGLPASNAALIAEVRRRRSDTRGGPPIGAPQRGDSADDLLRMAGAFKPDQEVAGLVVRLDDGEAATVLDGAASRPLPEIQGILDLLLTIEADTKVDLLLRRVAAGSPQRTVELAAALAETDAVRSAALLNYAVAVAAGGRPHWVIDLVAGLSRRGMKDAADTVVAEAVARLRGADAAEVADALREAGREAESARLYAAALPEIARRTPQQVALVAADLMDHRFTDAALELVDRAARESSTAAARAQLLGALIGGPALATLRWSLVATLGGSLDRASLLELADLLGEHGSDPVEIYIAAAVPAPITAFLDLLEDILDKGRLRDAFRLVDWAATARPGEDLADVALWFPAPYRAGLLRRLLAGAATVPPATMVTFYLGVRVTDHDLAEAIEREWAGRSPAELLGLAAELARHGEIRRAGLLLRDSFDAGAFAELAGVDGATLITGLQGEPALDGLVTTLAVHQLKAGGSADWALADLPPEVIDGVAGAVDNQVLATYLIARPASEIVTVLEAVARTGSTAKLSRLLGRLAGGGVDLVAALLIEMHRAGRPDLRLEFVDRFRSVASKADAAAVASRIRLADVEDSSSSLLLGSLWLPARESADPVAMAVADFLHGVRLRGEAWRYPIDAAVLRAVAEEGLLAPDETCLLVWQWAILPRRERIVFTTTEARPWRGSAVAYRDIRNASVDRGDLRVLSSWGPVTWTLNSAFLAPELRDVLLALRDVVRKTGV
ncbi:hypothetical protein Aab01nite_06870 [Paractinoplanes abujensis]|uniref:Peptidase C14 caspase domain-containing protein n=1 Tax=Paractinoplanes abujensis TaxID=882441 RepID=A0A7W7CQM7_9ACTN|nr:caspase family protein [Actinoplanes abujensis]MBB4691488.1 hypothetical protein [Actinoplanes abujensis]GID17097.1 hypothetical protein Aab01nite_06870 [Actinoplanes abujensis]